MGKEIKRRKRKKMRKCCYFLFVLMLYDEKLFRRWEPSLYSFGHWSILMMCRGEYGWAVSPMLFRDILELIPKGWLLT
jgi:hypothetical protein